MIRLLLLCTFFSFTVLAERKMEDFHRKKFTDAVESGEIVRFCQNRESYGVPFFAFGGNLFWETVNYKDWKLQQNKISGNWRIVDPSGIRRARGKSMHQLEEFFRNHPVSLKENKRLEGNRFFYYPGTNGETVILIHGWNVRASYVSRMAVFLQSKGYTVLNFDYATEKLNIKDHAKQFTALMRSEQIKGKIHYVVHSMGGLVIRHALANMTEEECRQIDSVVMLAPANQGSDLAAIGKLIYPNDKSLGDMIPGSEALNIPLPPYYPPVGIVAAKYDGKVSFKKTTIPGNVPFQRTTVKSNHPDMRFPRISGEMILKFFREKKFY